MNKREARCEALNIAANILENDADNPGPFEHLSYEDMIKVSGELEAISRELRSRGDNIQQRMFDAGKLRDWAVIDRNEMPKSRFD